MVSSVAYIKPGDSGVVIGYRVDEFSHLVGRTLHCVVTHSPLFHGQGIHIKQLPT